MALGVPDPCSYGWVHVDEAVRVARDISSEGLYAAEPLGQLIPEDALDGRDVGVNHDLVEELDRQVQVLGGRRRSCVRFFLDGLKMAPRLVFDLCVPEMGAAHVKNVSGVDDLNPGLGVVLSHLGMCDGDAIEQVFVYLGFQVVVTGCSVSQVEITDNY